MSAWISAETSRCGSRRGFDHRPVASAASAGASPAPIVAAVSAAEAFGILRLERFGFHRVGLPIGVDARDAQHGDVLAVAVPAAAVLPAALLEDDDLVQAVLRDHRRGDRGAGHDR